MDWLQSDPLAIFWKSLEKAGAEFSSSTSGVRRGRPTDLRRSASNEAAGLG